jgi:hypothetical protein
MQKFTLHMHDNLSQFFGSDLEIEISARPCRALLGRNHRQYKKSTELSFVRMIKA